MPSAWPNHRRATAVLLDSALGRGKTPADPRPIRRNQAASAPRQQFGVWRQATGALVVRVGRGAPCEDPRLGASGLTRRPRLVLTVLSGPCVTNTSIPSQQTAYRASLCIEKFNEANACVCVKVCVCITSRRHRGANVMYVDSVRGLGRVSISRQVPLSDLRPRCLHPV
jgi:hypothetical protein